MMLFQYRCLHADVKGETVTILRQNYSDYTVQKLDGSAAKDVSRWKLKFEIPPLTDEIIEDADKQLVAADQRANKIAAADDANVRCPSLIPWLGLLIVKPAFMFIVTILMTTLFNYGVLICMDKRCAGCQLICVGIVLHRRVHNCWWSIRYFSSVCRRCVNVVLVLSSSGSTYIHIIAQEFALHSTTCYVQAVRTEFYALVSFISFL